MRIGVIGLGSAGSIMLRAMAHHPDIHVTAAADVHQQHLARFQEDFGGLAFEDAAALCASPEVDAAAKLLEQLARSHSAPALSVSAPGRLAGAH